MTLVSGALAALAASAMPEAAAEPALASISHVIQLSVAPVFLLSGVGALLNVLTNRLARIVDRARHLEADAAAQAPPTVRQNIRHALRRMALRARLVSWAISLCTASALLICAVIVVLFVGTFAGLGLGPVIATGFVAAMLSLIVALLFFLREIDLATRHLRIGLADEEDAVPAGTSPAPRQKRLRRRAARR